MSILEEKTAGRTSNTIPLVINNLKFFDMSKSKTKNPVLQKDGVKISCPHSLSVIYN
jgi:hypothetical protein